ncbi:MAG: hypothetical protein RIT81_47185 [Deltaproteobacteria bacterium]
MNARHAPPNLDADAARAAAGVPADAEHVTKLVWIPFVLHKKRAAVAPRDPASKLPLPSRCPLVEGAPEGVVVDATSTLPLVYFPFWSIETIDTRTYVSATDGAVTREAAAPLPAAPSVATTDQSNGYVIAVAVLGMFLLFNTGFLGYLAIQFVALFIRADIGAVLMQNIDAPLPPTQVAALFAVVVLNAVLIFRYARIAVGPALAEAVTRRDGTFGPQGARLAKYTAVVTSIGVGISLPGSVSDKPISLVALGFASVGLLWLAVEGFRPNTVDRPGIPSDHPLIRSATNVLAILAVTVTLAYFLFMSGGYRSLSRFIGTPLESNDMEGLLLSFVAALALARTRLAPAIKYPVVGALLVSVVMKPVGVPALTILAQFIVVTVLSRLLSDEETPTTSEAIAHGLATEAGIVAGVLFGRLALTLLLGTLGWVVGEVAGECIGGVLAAQRASDAPSSSRRPPAAAPGPP